MLCFQQHEGIKIVGEWLDGWNTFICGKWWSVTHLRVAWLLVWVQLQQGFLKGCPLFPTTSAGHCSKCHWEATLQLGDLKHWWQDVAVPQAAALWQHWLLNGSIRGDTARRCVQKILSNVEAEFLACKWPCWLFLTDLRYCRVKSTCLVSLHSHPWDTS